MDRDRRGLAIRVDESPVPLRQFQIRAVSEYINDRLVAGWECWRFGLDGRRNVDPTPSMSVTAGGELAQGTSIIPHKTFSELTEAERAELQDAFDLPNEIFEALANGPPLHLPEHGNKEKDGKWLGRSRRDTTNIVLTQ